MKHSKKIILCLTLFHFALNVSGYPHQNPSQDPELIRDTDLADETENLQPDKPKVRNPFLASQNISIGNHYLKQKNYIAAISRYLQALEYQPDSIQAHEVLGKAYEKNGDFTKALALYNKFINDNPNSTKIADFRSKIAKISKKK